MSPGLFLDINGPASEFLTIGPPADEKNNEFLLFQKYLYNAILSAVCLEDKNQNCAPKLYFFGNKTKKKCLTVEISQKLRIFMPLLWTTHWNEVPVAVLRIWWANWKVFENRTPGRSNLANCYVTPVKGVLSSLKYEISIFRWIFYV